MRQGKRYALILSRNCPMRQSCFACVAAKVWPQEVSTNGEGRVARGERVEEALALEVGPHGHAGPLCSG